MGARNLEKLFKDDKQGPSQSDKELIQQYQKAIADKLRDPDFAKKAAIIIEQMLNEKQKKNK